ncbi:cbb3-type cytochrome c oxidase subunit 3 [Propionivibrio sp.]|uniref:cbb3-type cytochrome oxidase subunit 3 n=1 Tax=Propionivibrio sp. TaxID=2212460 RepID=UPI0025F4E431|nr:cbb3-type cytochrome c oxidase subunit 3 [Propionivibrio sp.]MBK7355749.1 cbb3-type cytochrome c oxidase subunit 3 [Propionivibrio sp.]MBK8400587.1 cbb3-type cytochrome c oxidase subunit 3 [Propionivibrio sp.]MBK8744340.1 cbb3-type cytochrome c oxidase subunit 3 [Propionivibrio sp.]MBK8895148.1 cbb3-type cytochrome c oxidase subunit 3 [Propionivibrio sp.]MBL0206946.1 cbb3-type cytochrome c oxidase subunit 3 [Propionivibrio sp.]
MDINDLRSIVTVLSMLSFLGIVWWAYGVKSNKKRFEEAANLPFADEETDRAELGLSSGDELRKTS